MLHFLPKKHRCGPVYWGRIMIKEEDKMVTRRVQINIDGEEQVFMIPVAPDPEGKDMEDKDIPGVYPVLPRED